MFHKIKRNLARTAIAFLTRWSDEVRVALASLYRPQGKFKIEHFRGGVKIGEYALPNGIKDVGLTHMLETEFHAGTPITSWFIGIIDNASWSAEAAGDTMASHSGWIEFITFSQSTRVAWGMDAASARSISNSTAAVFDITGTATLKGIFVTSGSAKSGTSGTLWSTADFASTVGVVNGDQLKVTYTVSG